eukprot:TRINITY_DN6867_c0_g2_i1.p1 TRINITY_DN6867_c0_g2~~TRINITY_DN6867_c0_g2_i1.p1  ORF type:complete len:258 (+),score=55.70 TRINITY_DN6867_c0_g2_i1:175-948(+)
MASRFSAAPRTVCPVCTKTVYMNDEVRIGENLVLHKTCFRCSHCNKVLSNTNFSTYEGIYYCKPHFMALFKARGKYDDLGATGDATRLRASISGPPPSASSYDASPFSATVGANSGFKLPTGNKKGDMNSALRTRNPEAVKTVIDKKGYHVMFSSGVDGVTALETAFTTGNIESGRIMVKLIAAALQGGEFVWEKPAEDNKEDAPAAAPAEEHHHQSHAQAHEPDPEPYSNAQDVVHEYSGNAYEPEAEPQPQSYDY